MWPPPRFRSAWECLVDRSSCGSVDQGSEGGRRRDGRSKAARHRAAARTGASPIPVPAVDWLREQYVDRGPARFRSRAFAALLEAGVTFRRSRGNASNGGVLDDATLAALVAQGLSATQMADRTGYSLAGVYKLLRRAGLAVKARELVEDQADLDEVRRLYESGSTVTQIGRLLGHGEEWGQRAAAHHRRTSAPRTPPGPLSGPGAPADRRPHRPGTTHHLRAGAGQRMVRAAAAAPAAGARSGCHLGAPQVPAGPGQHRALDVAGLLSSDLDAGCIPNLAMMDERTAPGA